VGRISTKNFVTLKISNTNNSIPESNREQKIKLPGAVATGTHIGAGTWLMPESGLAADALDHPDRHLCAPWVVSRGWSFGTGPSRLHPDARQNKGKGRKRKTF